MDNGKPVLPGAYDYRVAVVDEAGLVSQSVESRPLQLTASVPVAVTVPSTLPVGVPAVPTVAQLTSRSTTSTGAKTTTGTTGIPALAARLTDGATGVTLGNLVAMVDAEAAPALSTVSPGDGGPAPVVTSTVAPVLPVPLTLSTALDGTLALLDPTSLLDLASSPAPIGVDGDALLAASGLAVGNPAAPSTTADVVGLAAANDAAAAMPVTSPDPALAPVTTPDDPNGLANGAVAPLAPTWVADPALSAPLSGPSAADLNAAEVKATQADAGCNPLPTTVTGQSNDGTSTYNVIATTCEEAWFYTSSDGSSWVPGTTAAGQSASS